MAFAVNFPFKCGRHLIVAFAAPVSVNTRFSGAERPRLFFLCMLSIKFWSFVNAWTVSKCPEMMPAKLSSISLIVGTTALVVPNMKFILRGLLQNVCWINELDVSYRKEFGQEYLRYSDYVHDAALNIVSSLLTKIRVHWCHRQCLECHLCQEQLAKRDAPFDFKCRPKPARSLQMPVLSTTSASLIP